MKTKKILQAVLMVVLVIGGIILAFKYIEDLHYMLVSIMAIGILAILTIGRDL